jgi:hypothetical protein
MLTVRMTGIAITRHTEDRTVFAVAVPVVGHDGQAIAALELTNLPARNLDGARAGLAVASRSFARLMADDDQRRTLVVSSEALVRRAPVRDDLTPHLQPLSG